MSGTNGMLPTMYDVEPVPKAERVHQSQLPITLCEELLSFLTREGEIILDQYAGSRTTGAAAYGKRRSSILIEKVHEMVEQMKARIKRRNKIMEYKNFEKVLVEMVQNKFGEESAWQFIR